MLIPIKILFELNPNFWVVVERSAQDEMSIKLFHNSMVDYRQHTESVDLDIEILESIIQTAQEKEEGQ